MHLHQALDDASVILGKIWLSEGGGRSHISLAGKVGVLFVVMDVGASGEIFLDFRVIYPMFEGEEVILTSSLYSSCLCSWAVTSIEGIHLLLLRVQSSH